MNIQLTTAEIMIGAQAGVMRQVENLKLGRIQAYGLTDDIAWSQHIEGALGEMALAKALNYYWSGKGAFRGSDVFNVEVRTTKYKNGHLILHSEDDSNKPFFLVTGENGMYTIVGSIMARDGKLDKYWGDPVGGRPAFWVPQGALTPIQNYAGVES